MKVWSREFTLEMIEVLRSLPVLWNMELPEYRSPEARLMNYEILLMKVREFDPDATIRDVKNKIKTLRTTLTKIEKRVEESRRFGVPHKPSLYYYNALSFLLPMSRKLNPAPNKRKRRQDNYQSEENSENNTLKLYWNVSGVETSPQPSPKRCSDESSVFSQEENETVNDEVESEAGEYKTESEHNEVVTDCEVFGQYVAAKLVSMAQIQRIFLEKIINDAIYQAELGNLTANTRLCREEGYDSVEYTVDNHRTQYVTEEIQIGNSQQNGILVQEIMINPDGKDDKVNMKQIKVERQNSYESWRENQIVPEAGPSNILVQTASIDGVAHFHTQTIHSDESASAAAERIRPLSTGAVLERIDDRMQIDTHSGEIIQKIGEHNYDQNRIIYVENNKALEEAIMCGRSIVIQNGSYLEPVQRQGVIVEKASVEAGMRYVMQQGGTRQILKNIQFADDDLIKLCEDDGISIIVGAAENAERRTH